MPDDPAEPPLEVLLERVGAAVGRHRRRIAAAHGLTPTAMAVLAALDGVGAGGMGGVRGDPARSPSHHDQTARRRTTTRTARRRTGSWPGGWG